MKKITINSSAYPELLAEMRLVRDAIVDEARVVLNRPDLRHQQVDYTPSEYGVFEDGDAYGIRDRNQDRPGTYAFLRLSQVWIFVPDEGEIAASLDK